MSTKYFCDVCNKEIPWEERIQVLGITTKRRMETLCANCWKKVEGYLLNETKVVKNEV